MSFLIVLVALFLLMWVFMIRPQKRRQAEQQALLNAVATGDEVITAGGLYGTVRAVEEDTISLEVAPEVEVRIARRAIASVLRDEPEEEEPEDEEDEAVDTEPTEAARG